MTYLRTISNKVTPQNEPIPGSDQVINNAGGYSWSVDDWVRLERFLVLGSEGGTYYVGEHTLTRENASVVERCIKVDGRRTVDVVVEISDQGRAPKNDPAIFVLAMAASIGDDATRKLALESLPKVCRIGTHLMHFAAYVEQFRGWGRGLRRSIGKWYNDKPAKDVAYQVVKYQHRDRWGNRDLLRLSHPKPSSNQHRDIYHWVTQGWENIGDDPHPVEALRIIWAFERAKIAESKKEIVNLIRDYDLPREAIPTKWLSEIDVWQELLVNMPMTAMIRNLATMTRIGLITPMGYATQMVVDSLGKISKSRIHPIAVLSALMTYAQGHGEKSDNTWIPVTQIIDALDAAFYTSFSNIESTKKRLLLGVDVSGSMNNGVIAGISGLTPLIASAAMALITASTEPICTIMAFSDKFVQLNISSRNRLDDVVRIMRSLPYGATDCAIPMIWAKQNKINVDGFIIYTDSETWYGNIHPVQALDQYRKQSKIASKLAVVGMVSNGFSIADPNDSGMLDVVGFDTATPNLIGNFVK